MKLAEAFPPPDNFTDRRRFGSVTPGGFGTRPRTWADVKGITLHQTACVLGTRDERWDTLGAHFGVMVSGRVTYVQDVLKLVWHAQGWSPLCVGIEIDGLFPGELGESVWDNPATSQHEQASKLTDAQVTATQQLIRWICSTVQQNGGKVRTLCSHRQSSGSRRDDPGAEVWQRIALPVSAELGLDDGGPTFKLGDGRPNPEGWNPAHKGVKY